MMHQSWTNQLYAIDSRGTKMFLKLLYTTYDKRCLKQWPCISVKGIHFFLYFKFFDCVSLRSEFRYDFNIETMSGSSLPPVICRRAHVLFMLFVFVCSSRCPTHIVWCFCFVSLHLVHPMLPVSLDCPLLIAPSVSSNLCFYDCSKKNWNCSDSVVVFFSFFFVIVIFYRHYRQY